MDARGVCESKYSFARLTSFEKSHHDELLAGVVPSYVSSSARGLDLACIDGAVTAYPREVVLSIVEG